MFEVGGISKQIEDRQYEVIEALTKFSSSPNMNAVEIGSWSGNSAVIIGKVVERVFGKLYCIDWFKGDETNDGHLKETSEKIDVSSIFRKNIEYFNLSNTVELRIKSSTEASKEFEDNSLDFIFIDGGHSVKDVFNDILLWYPKLKSSRVICGHDFNMTAVKGAVYSIFKMEEVGIEEDIWWVRKT
jgi:predicted O-methyltransferase YrrM